MTKEKKEEIAKNLSAEELLNAYDVFCKRFDPFSDDFVESYDVIRVEILKRCSIANRAEK